MQRRGVTLDLWWTMSTLFSFLRKFPNFEMQKCVFYIDQHIQYCVLSGVCKWYIWPFKMIIKTGNWTKVCKCFAWHIPNMTFVLLQSTRIFVDMLLVTQTNRISLLLYLIQSWKILISDILVYILEIHFIKSHLIFLKPTLVYLKQDHKPILLLNMFSNLTWLRLSDSWPYILNIYPFIIICLFTVLFRNAYVSYVRVYVCIFVMLW